MIWLLTPSLSAPVSVLYLKHSGILAVYQTGQLLIHFKILALDVSFICNIPPREIFMAGSQTSFKFMFKFNGTFSETAFTVIYLSYFVLLPNLIYRHL